MQAVLRRPVKRKRTVSRMRRPAPNATNGRHSGRPHIRRGNIGESLLCSSRNLRRKQPAGRQVGAEQLSTTSTRCPTAAARQPVRRKAKKEKLKPPPPLLQSRLLLAIRIASGWRCNGRKTRGCYFAGGAFLAGEVGVVGFGADGPPPPTAGVDDAPGPTVELRSCRG